MYSLLLLDAPDKERSLIGSTSDAKILKTILQSFSTLTLVCKCTVAFNKISYECNKMHWNKLPSTLIFKIFWGSTRFPCAGGGALLQHIIPQDRRYRDEIVLRLLYNFLLLHFFNLKTLFLLSNSQGRTRGGEPAMVLVGFEFCLLFYLTDLSLHVTA